MNPSDWRKAAALVTQQKKEATMAEMDQLSSMPLRWQLMTVVHL